VIDHGLGASSIIAWNRTELRRDAVGQIEEDLVDIAPSPSFRWIVAFDDRMAGGMEMLGGMAIRRVVATADMAAGAT
jgi:hypothetical protein